VLLSLIGINYCAVTASVVPVKLASCLVSAIGDHVSIRQRLPTEMMKFPWLIDQQDCLMYFCNWIGDKCAKLLTAQVKSEVH